MKIFSALLLAMAFSVAIAEGPPFKRYQTIIDRKPFGPEPVGFDPESAPGSAASGGEIAEGEMTPEQRSAEEQQLAANVRVSILNVTPAGDVKVGFTDSSAKPPENYYLKVGASQNGWTVKAADPAAESVTLEKGGVEVTVKLGETTGGKGGAKGGMPGRGLMRGGRFGRADDGAAPRSEGALHQRMGGIARLRQQRMEEEARAREAAEKKREADAAAKAEREEREAREAEEKQRAAEERAQQREALLQIQEQLKKQREENEAKRERQEQQGEEDNDT